MKLFLKALLLSVFLLAFVGCGDSSTPSCYSEKVAHSLENQSQGILDQLADMFVSLVLRLSFGKDLGPKVKEAYMGSTDFKLVNFTQQGHDSNKNRMYCSLVFTPVFSESKFREKLEKIASEDSSGRIRHALDYGITSKIADSFTENVDKHLVFSYEVVMGEDKKIKVENIKRK